MNLKNMISPLATSIRYKNGVTWHTYILLFYFKFYLT